MQTRIEELVTVAGQVEPSDESGLKRLKTLLVDLSQVIELRGYTQLRDTIEKAIEFINKILTDQASDQNSNLDHLCYSVALLELQYEALAQRIDV